MPQFYQFSTCILLTVLICACGSNESKNKTTEANEPPYLIKVEIAEKEKEEVFLSDFAESIEYVQLETSEETFIGRGAHFYLTQEHVISSAFRQILLFDRADGSFTQEIGKYGQGPQEYTTTYPQLHFNEKEEVTYVRDSKREPLGLDVSGNIKVKFKFPTDDQNLVTGFVQIEPDLFAGYHPNYDCNQGLKLILFDKEGKVVKTYKNHLSCINTQPGAIFFSLGEGEFYQWDDRVFFKENYNDTLFHVNVNSLDVQAIFDCGEYSLPYEDKTALNDKSKSQQYFLVSDPDETPGFIFFKLDFEGKTRSAYYDKSQNITKVAFLQGAENSRFANDLDDFLPFSVDYATEDGKLVGHMEAPEVIEWFEANPEKAAKLSPDLKRFANIKEDDNPIVIIVSLKN